MRSLLLKVHIYAGLLCSSYLLIFGISSLNYNHKFGTPANKKVTWERPLKLVDMDNDTLLSETVRDDLGLVGWTIPWETHRDDNGNFRFGLSRPGKRYTIHVLFDQSRVIVEETRGGIWAVVNSLHGLMEVPSSAFLVVWAAYTELCTWAVLLSAASGVYLWTRRQKERFMGWIVLGGASGTSLILMVYLWWRG